MQAPHGRQRDDEHDDVGERVDGRRRDQQEEGVDAGVSRDFRLADTLQKHREHQGHTVQQVEPDQGPDGIKRHVLLYRRWFKDAEKQQQDGELGEEDEDASDDLQVAKELPSTFSTPNGYACRASSSGPRFSHLDEMRAVRRRHIPHVDTVAIFQGLEQEAGEPEETDLTGS